MLGEWSVSETKGGGHVINKPEWLVCHYLGSGIFTTMRCAWDLALSSTRHTEYYRQRI